MDERLVDIIDSINTWFTVGRRFNETSLGMGQEHQEGRCSGNCSEVFINLGDKDDGDVISLFGVISQNLKNFCDEGWKKNFP